MFQAVVLKAGTRALGTLICGAFLPGVWALDVGSSWSVPQPELRPHPAQLAVADPATFPHEADFRQRAERIIAQLANDDLGRWRRGYFKGGDPGKYLPISAWAQLIRDAEDPEPRRYLNDKRSPSEHYHFAALNQVRTLGLFDWALTEATKQRTAEYAANYSIYLGAPGTENHKVMSRLPVLALVDVLPGDSEIGKRSRAEAHAITLAWLKDWVRGLYTYGMGEWESTTYHMFCLNSLLNVYDFAEDPEARAWAAAGLEYLTAAVAQKYRDGIASGPSQRGMSTRPFRTYTGQEQWLWYGARIIPERTGFRFAMHAALSTWRPNAVLSALGTKQFNGDFLPFEAKNSKPNYWLGLGIPPQKNVTQETLWVDKSFTLGSLWSGWDPFGQTNRWQLTCIGNPAIAFTGGQHYSGRNREGLGRFDQTLQYRDALIVLSRVPTESEWQAQAERRFAVVLREGQKIRTLVKDPQQGDHPQLHYETRQIREEDRAEWVRDFVEKELAQAPPYSFFRLPPAAPTPINVEGVWLFQLSESYLAVTGLGDAGKIGTLPPSAKAVQRAKKRGRVALGEAALLFERPADGEHFGFVVQVANKSDYPSMSAFRAALNQPEVDHQLGEVALLARDATPLRLRWQPGGGRGAAWVNNVPVDFADWAVMSSPALFVDQGVLRVFDGVAGYQIDVTGANPVWTDWQQAANAL
jgi:hypothetical protein